MTAACRVWGWVWSIHFRCATALILPAPEPWWGSLRSTAVDASGGDKAQHHHRSILGGGARAAVFGVSDGLVTNVSLILGVAAAHPGGGFVRLTGLAGLVAGAFSMAAGEYVSMEAQRELLQRELDIE